MSGLSNTEYQHAQMVRDLVTQGEGILKTLTPEGANLWHMASCIPGEAGELFDAIKKLVIYNKSLDRDNVVEELGDIEFYLQGLRDALGITRKETLQFNLDKLAKRYEDLKYSDAQAQALADKD